MWRLIPIILIVLVPFPAGAGAANLAFSLGGLQGEQERNVRAWLGSPPETVPDRLNFVVSARDRIERGLQALGYYRPDIELDVQRNEPVWQMDIVVNPGDPVRINDINIQVRGPGANDPQFARLMAETDLVSGDVLHHGLGRPVLLLARRDDREERRQKEQSTIQDGRSEKTPGAQTPQEY